MASESNQGSEKSRSKTAVYVNGILWILLLYGLEFLLDLRAFMCSCMLISAVFFILMLVIKRLDKKVHHAVVEFAWSGCIVSSIFVMRVAIIDFSFADGVFSAFWEIALALAIAAGCVITRLHLWGFGKLGRIAMIAVISFFGFLLFNGYLVAFNYVLDKTEPQKHVAVIEDKDYNHRRRAPSSYSIKEPNPQCLRRLFSV